MRIVVTSDSHRNSRNFFKVIDRHLKNADLFIDLGDSEEEIDLLEMTQPNIRIKGVRGNNDWNRVAPYEQIINFNGKKIFFTHGHHYHVKYGLGELISRARLEGADVCLFGHTHTPYFEIVDGLYVMNPGAICENSYGIIDIEPSGIMAYTTKINR
ncbi:MAG: metallophosphoesterase [Eubacterium sp.]|nr:metallophosphoesterase [Eubacterium sp.]